MYTCRRCAYIPIREPHICELPLLRSICSCAFKRAKRLRAPIAPIAIQLCSNTQQLCHRKILVRRPGATLMRRPASSTNRTLNHHVSAHCTANKFVDLLSPPDFVKIIVPDCLVSYHDSLVFGRQRRNLHTILCRFRLSRGLPRSRSGSKYGSLDGLEPLEVSF